MNKNTSIAIIAGLAVGAFVGYESMSWGVTLSNTPPWSWVYTYVSSQVTSMA